MKKSAIILLAAFILFGCTSPQNADPSISIEPADSSVTFLPEKENPNDTFASTSPITPKNLDDYLFRDDCIYLDTRYPYQFYQEGFVAGFTNLPFYEYIADFNKDTEALFTIVKVTNEDGSVILPGNPGSFKPNYEESEELIKDLIPNDKNILVIATAGVESCYFLNLLIQLGYDPAKLYNVGSFTTGMGDDIAYRYNSEAKYIVPPMELYETSISYSWNNLTPIQK